MPRVTKALSAKAKHKKVLKATKGHYGARSRLFKTAKQSYIKSLQYSFRDRRNRKRDFRNLWIARINAAVSKFDISYSKFMHKLSLKKVFLNRKILSELAISEPDIFEKIITFSKD